MFHVLGLTLLLSAPAMAEGFQQPLRHLDETHFLSETRNFAHTMEFKGWTPAELSRKEDENVVVASYVMKKSTLCVVTYDDKDQEPREMVYIVAPSDVRADAPLMTDLWSKEIEEVLAVAGAQLFAGHVGKGSPLHTEMMHRLGPDSTGLKVNQGVSMELPVQQVRMEAHILQNPLAYILKINKEATR